MQYLGAILIQSAIAMFSSVSAIRTFPSFRKTRDKGKKVHQKKWKR